MIDAIQSIIDEKSKDKVGLKCRSKNIPTIFISSIAHCLKIDIIYNIEQLNERLFHLCQKIMFHVINNGNMRT